MKKFIFKLFKLLFIILIAIILLIWMFSNKHNETFQNTVIYLKTLALETFNPSKTTSNNAMQPEDLEISSDNNKYYYSQLTDESKIIYSKLENNIDNLKTENYVIDFSTTFNDLLNENTGQYTLKKSFQSSLDAFFYDHPELFYLDLGKFLLDIKCVSLGPIKTYYVEIVPSDNQNYLMDSFDSKEEVEIAINQIENIKNDIINSVSNLSTYYKIKYVHDFLVNTLKYNENIENGNSYNIYGAFIEKSVVCEGYAKAFKYIMDALDIECILISGTVTSSYYQDEPHMWNYVNLDNYWYGVDVTWDDPVSYNGTSSTIRHSYFLKGSGSFASSHTPDGKLSNTSMLFSIPILSNNNYR